MRPKSKQKTIRVLLLKNSTAFPMETNSNGHKIGKNRKTIRQNRNPKPALRSASLVSHPTAGSAGRPGEVRHRRSGLCKTRSRWFLMRLGTTDGSLFEPTPSSTKRRVPQAMTQQIRETCQLKASPTRIGRSSK